MTPVKNVLGLSGINREQRLYVLPCGDGYSCLGFDVCKRRTAAIAAEIGRPDLAPPARVGTVKAFKTYQAAQRAAHEYYTRTGKKLEAELIPALKGYEGLRIEARYPDGSKRRFYVGKSTGWIPCHLEIMRSNSHGGGAVYWPEGTTFSVIGGRR